MVNIGLIGLGTIGSGVVNILKNNSELIEKRTGTKINLKKICDIKPDLAKELNIQDILTSDHKEIINDKEIDIIIELIGGYEPARTIIEEALKNKKHVVTANKAVIAKHGNELFKTAKENNVSLLFEAAVGGCIPIIKTLKQSYISEKIKSIYGILNGTTNYILTKMSEGLKYEDALKDAKELGFAEPDPTFDVEGLDASQKLAILSSLAFNHEINDSIYTEGISKLSRLDIMYAHELGYQIKLLAIAKKLNGEIELRVHPTMIPKSHELCSVINEFNAIYVNGENITDSMLYGKGAGKLPTATVVMGDIIDIANNNKTPHNSLDDVNIKDIDTIESRYYLRLKVIEKPGVLAAISKILGDNNISISGVQQKEIEKDIVTIIILTRKAVEKDIKKSTGEINKLDIVKDNPIIIRIEDM